MRVAVAFILLISLAVVMAFTTEKERPVYEDEPDGTSPGLPRDKRQRFIYTGDESEEDNLPSILEGDENEEDDKVESLKKRLYQSYCCSNPNPPCFITPTDCFRRWK
ncbi:uncharacterized protein LOC144663782 isoform X3 [Oculina patagonica]